MLITNVIECFPEIQGYENINSGSLSGSGSGSQSWSGSGQGQGRGKSQGQKQCWSKKNILGKNVGSIFVGPCP